MNKESIIIIKLYTSELPINCLWLITGLFDNNKNGKTALYLKGQETIKAIISVYRAPEFCFYRDRLNINDMQKSLSAFDRKTTAIINRFEAFKGGTEQIELRIDKEDMLEFVVLARSFIDNSLLESREQKQAIHSMLDEYQLLLKNTSISTEIENIDNITWYLRQYIKNIKHVTYRSYFEYYQYLSRQVKYKTKIERLIEGARYYLGIDGNNSEFVQRADLNRLRKLLVMY